MIVRGGDLSLVYKSTLEYISIKQQLLSQTSETSLDMPLNFLLQAKCTVDEATDRGVQTFTARCGTGSKSE